jgi:hypothetical protein
LLRWRSIANERVDCHGEKGCSHEDWKPQKASGLSEIRFAGVKWRRHGDHSPRVVDKSLALFQELLSSREQPDRAGASLHEIRAPPFQQGEMGQHLFSADFQSRYLRLHYAEVFVRLLRGAGLPPRVVKRPQPRGERRVVAPIEDGRSDGGWSL